MSPKKNAASEGIERRRSKRRPILSTFSLFVVLPKKGFHRLMVHDVSDLGIGFDADTEGEETGGFPLKVGEPLDLRLYLNQSLYLPLSVRIVRLEERNTIRRVGAAVDEGDPSFAAFTAFINLLDQVADVARIEQA